MNSNQVPLVGENVTQTYIYISVIIPTLMADSCDPILLHFEVIEVVLLTGVCILSSPSLIMAKLLCCFSLFLYTRCLVHDLRYRMAKRIRLSAVSAPLSQVTLNCSVAFIFILVPISFQFQKVEHFFYFLWPIILQFVHLLNPVSCHILGNSLIKMLIFVEALIPLHNLFTVFGLPSLRQHCAGEVCVCQCGYNSFPS